MNTALTDHLGAQVASIQHEVGSRVNELIVAMLQGIGVRANGGNGAINLPAPQVCPVPV